MREGRTSLPLGLGWGQGSGVPEHRHGDGDSPIPELREWGSGPKSPKLVPEKLRLVPEISPQENTMPLLIVLLVRIRPRPKTAATWQYVYLAVRTPTSSGPHFRCCKPKTAGCGRVLLVLIHLRNRIILLLCMLQVFP